MKRGQFLRSATSTVAIILVGCAQQQPTATGRAVGSATFALTGKLNIARWQHTATLLGDGRVLVVGGIPHVGGSQSSSAEVYDPATGKWTVTGNTGGARYGHTATLLKDGRVLVAGGGGGSGTSAELYDPATAKWAATGDLAKTRSGHTAILLGDGGVLVAGGFDIAGPTAELYDPATGKWTPTGDLTVARTQHRATLLADGKVLVVGGGQSVAAAGPPPPLASAELYDPAAGTWAATSNMKTARSWFSMTLLADGRVLVSGGFGDGGLLSGAEVYDPTAGKWTTTGSLKTSLSYHSATLLGNGKVLVAGGYPDPPPRDRETEASSSVELFDPTTGTWTEIGNLQIGRGFHTATLLNNGKVLVAGGSLGKIKDDDDRSGPAELGTYVP